MRHKACQQAIIQYDRIQGPNAQTIFNVGKSKIAVNQAVADTGATEIFALPGAPVTDTQPATNPLVVNLPMAKK